MKNLRRLFTRPGWFTVISVYGAAAVASWDGPIAFTIGVLLTGLVEYIVHRWAFHGAERAFPRAYDAIHGAHHRLPDDPGRRIVPLTHSAPVALLAWSALPAGVFSGFAAGYLAYEIAHAVCHLRGRLPASLRPLRRHHARHHHVDPGAAFGVTSPLWDMVFGTMPRAPHPWAVAGSDDDPRPEAL